jgi:hypothetical protein
MGRLSTLKAGRGCRPDQPYGSGMKITISLDAQARRQPDTPG